MKTYELTIENNEITSVACYKEVNDKFHTIKANLFIPKNVTEICCSALMGCYPEDIIVEEGNENFCVREHCLFSKDGKDLLMLSKKSTIPADTKGLGNCLMGYVCSSRRRHSVKVSEVLFEGIEIIGSYAFESAVNRGETVLIPSSVKRIKLMGLNTYETSVTFEFLGDPELEVGAFGTEAEITDTDLEADDIYKNLPKIFYVKPEYIQVIAKANSGVAKYCKKYGIPVTLK